MNTHTNTDTHPRTPRRSAFQRAVVRVVIRGALSASAVLGLSFSIASTPASAASTALAPALPPPAKHPDFDHGALVLSSTTDTLPEDQAAHFETIAGSLVHRVYYLYNRGLLPLDHVTVVDPGNNGAAIRCIPSGTSTIATLLPLAGTACSATFTASPGEHQTTATASGTVFLFNVTISDEDPTGYTAVVPALSASLSLDSPGYSAANLPAGSPVSAAVIVHNTGSVVLTQVIPSPQSPLSISNCGHGGPDIDRLDPGEAAACTGVLIPAVRPHVSSVTITGTWRWDHPITEQGPQEPENLTIQAVAEAGYTGTPVTSPAPPPQTPPPSSPAPPPPTPAPPGTSPAVVIPQPQLPTPSPTPTPTSSQRPTPTPTPTQVAAVLQQAVSQFQASRELPLPLKVLVIIIIPAVAAAAGAHRLSSSRR